MRRSLTFALPAAVVLALAACATRPAPARVFPVFFADDSATLDAPAQDVVAQAAAIAKQFPAADVSVEGYADDPGNPTRSITLSSRRAQAVGALLVADGVAARRIKPAALGTPAGSEPGLASRRVEIDIAAN